MLIHKGVKPGEAAESDQQGLRALLIHKGVKRKATPHFTDICLRALLIHKGVKLYVAIEVTHPV